MPSLATDPKAGFDRCDAVLRVARLRVALRRVTLRSGALRSGEMRQDHRFFHSRFSTEKRP
jgi:hypothetical protein